MTWRSLFCVSLISLLLLSCDDDEGVDGDGDLDADVDSDVDSDADSDADGDESTDGEPDGSGDADVVDVPLEGFGAITGECGILDNGEWDAAEPFLYRNVVDFGSEVFDPTLLSDGAQEILEEGTAGGSSGNSEAISYDVLYRCELADLLLSETEVVYTNPDSSRTDFLASIDGRNIGVSVTRAFHFPPEDPCVEAEVASLIERKLDDALEAEGFAAPENPWERSILHVVAYNAQCADVTEAAYSTLDEATQADTILIITVAEGADEFIF